MAQSKEHKYSAGSKGDDGLGALSEKLALDLRKSIRSLGTCPLFSDPWMSMVDDIARISNITEMESHLTAADSKSDGATLWETKEQALRFLIEDGKLNVCLNNMVEFKKFQLNARRDPSSSSSSTAPPPSFEAGAKYGLTPSQSVSSDIRTEKSDRFEKCLGIILKNVWVHVEALQTTDLVVLIRHIASVMEGVSDSPEIVQSLSDLGHRQEVLVYHYLYDMLVRVDDIKEERVMPFIRESGIFMLAIRALSILHSHLTRTDTLKALGSLSLLVETEDFATYKDQYIKCTQDAQDLVLLNSSCIEVVNTDMENRKVVRPLQDCIDRAKRQWKIK